MELNQLGVPYDGTAIVLADDMVHGDSCKTTHALIRKSNRYKLIGVIDEQNAGHDAGVLLDGVSRDIGVYSSIENLIQSEQSTPNFSIVGVATSGGKLTRPIRKLLLNAIEQGISIVSGLHEHLCNDETIVLASKKHQVELIDIRKSKPFHELAFWSGEINLVAAPRIAVLGTDCCLGKRTTTQFLVDECRANGIKAEMVYTGQSGWLQGGRYGFILDSTPNDFVSGELEQAIVQCDRQAKPDVMFLEGQSALRNPSGPCGSELILSGGAKGVILQHAPGRKHFDLGDGNRFPMPPVSQELELIELYGAKTLALTMNREHLAQERIEELRSSLQSELGVPVIDPLGEGVSNLIPLVRKFLDRS
jgi:uncharacterized NAD-dependent epimerase/dehydratase family protein